MIIHTINVVDADHIELVKAQMAVMGAPTISGVFDGEVFVSLEGSHRLTAAAELHVTPNLTFIGMNDWLALDDLDAMFLDAAPTEARAAFEELGYEVDEVDLDHGIPAWLAVRILHQPADVIDFPEVTAPIYVPEDHVIDYAAAYARLCPEGEA
jgi:hypothetical protein